MKPIMFAEKNLRGLDLSADAESIGTGFFVRADNVVLDGPDFVVRPGKRGQLSAATGNAIYALEPFPSGSTSSSLFVSNSRLYKWTLGATSATEILDQTATSLGTARPITVADAFIARSLNLAYLVDGVGALYRCDLTDARAVTSLNRPSVPSSAIASDYEIDDGETYTNWSSMDGTVTSANTLTDGSFESGSASGGVIASPTSWSEFETGFGWDSVDNTVSSITAADSTYMCRLDRPGEARYQRITPETLSNPDGAYKVCRHYVLDAKVHSRDTTSLSSVVFQVSALDSSNTPMSVRTFEAIPAKPTGTGSTDWVSYSFGIGFTDLDNDPAKIEVAIMAGEQNTATVYVDKVTLYDASVYPFTFDGAANGFDVFLNATTNATSGRTKFLQNQGNLAGYTNGLYIYRDLGAETALSYKFFKAKIKITKAVLDSNPEFTLRLGVKKATGGIYWSAPGYYLSDTDYMYFDMSNIDPAVLAATRYLYIQLFGDQEGVGPSTAIFSFDGLYGVGGLSGQVPYWYKLVEINSNSDADLYDVIESDTSNPTPQVLTPEQGGMIQVTLPARTNSSADYFLLVRFGGTLVESERGKVPFGYVVAALTWATSTFAFGGDTDKGASPYYLYRANPHIKWTKTGSTGDAGSIILDSTPDSWLAHQAIVKEGKDQPPGSASDVAQWSNRIWLAKDSEVWGSWALSQNNAAGLYYSRIVLPSENDPHAPLKGYFQRLQVPAGDRIQRIIPYGRQLLVFTKLGLWVGTGDDPLSYFFREVPDAPGLVAKRAVTVFRGICYWLGPDGLYGWDGSKFSYVGAKLRRALYPQSVPGGLPHDPTALAKSYMVSGGRFLFLGVPETGAVGGNIDPAYTVSNQNGGSGTLGTVPNSGSATTNLNDGSTTTKEEASSVSFPDHRTTAFMDFGEDVVLSSWEATVRCFQNGGAGTGTYAVAYATTAAPTTWNAITSGSLTVTNSANYAGAADQALSGSISGTGRYVRITLLHVGAAEGGVAISECDSEASSSSDPTALYCLTTQDDKVSGWTKFTDWAMTSGAAFESPLDSADFVFCGTDGQLYKLYSTGDKATSGASTTSVTPYVTTRQFGDRSTRLAPGRFTWGLGHEATTSTTFYLQGDGPEWSKTKSIPAGDYNDWTRVSRAASGRLIQASISFATTGASRISNFMLEASPTRILR